MTHETRLKISKSSTRINLMNKSVELARAKSFLTNTDYIVIKIYEAVIKGQDTSELLSKYAEQLEKRETYRNSIDALEAEVKTLEKEWREERARIIAEETSEEVTKETEEPVTEVDTTNQTIDNTTNTSESVEEIPSEQPIEETPTDSSEVVEETPSEEIKEDVIEETTPSEEVIDVEPSEQPIEETTEKVENTPIEDTTEVVENLE